MKQYTKLDFYISALQTIISGNFSLVYYGHFSIFYFVQRDNELSRWRLISIHDKNKKKKSNVRSLT